MDEQKLSRLRWAVIQVLRKHKADGTDVINVMVRLIAEVLYQQSSEQQAVALKEVPLIITTYLKEIDQAEFERHFKRVSA